MIDWIQCNRNVRNLYKFTESDSLYDVDSKVKINQLLMKYFLSQLSYELTFLL